MFKVYLAAKKPCPWQSCLLTDQIPFAISVEILVNISAILFSILTFGFREDVKDSYWSCSGLITCHHFDINNKVFQLLLSCQPRVTVTSCFVNKVIRDLESIDHLCINPILQIGLIHK